VLQRVAVHCSVSQRVAVGEMCECGIAQQFVAVCCSELRCIALRRYVYGHKDSDIGPLIGSMTGPITSTT